MVEIFWQEVGEDFQYFIESGPWGVGTERWGRISARSAQFPQNELADRAVKTAMTNARRRRYLRRTLYFFIDQIGLPGT